MASRSNVSHVEELERLQASVHRAHRLLFRLEETVCSDSGITPGQRRILERLVQSGARTVPDLAREEGVSRQHVQVQVNHLLDEGLVRSKPNEAHRRSYLMQATPSGKKVLTRIRSKEQAVFRELEGPRRGANTAAQTLDRLTEAIEAWSEEEQV